jgi:hypothetical protein
MKFWKFPLAIWVVLCVIFIIGLLGELVNITIKISKKTKNIGTVRDKKYRR